VQAEVVAKARVQGATSYVAKLSCEVDCGGSIREQEAKRIALVQAKAAMDDATWQWLDAKTRCEEARKVFACLAEELDACEKGDFQRYQYAKEGTRRTREQVNSERARRRVQGARERHQREEAARAAAEEQRRRTAGNGEERYQSFNWSNFGNSYSSNSSYSAYPGTASRQHARRPSADLIEEMNSVVAKWRAATEVFFASSDQPFPEPPWASCGQLSCQLETRALAACAHHIRLAFQNIVPTIDVKRERLRWHPDKMKPEHQQKAREVFCVLQKLYEETVSR
jgi:hypothetical protein